MNNFLQFYDAYIEDDKMYFSARNVNGLFCYDFTSKITDLIAIFDGEALWGKHLHHQIITYNDNLYFIPFLGKNIAKFNLHTRELEYIKLFENEINTISGAFLSGDKLLLVPMYRPELFYLDLKTNRLENIHVVGLREILHDCLNGSILYDLQGTCMVESRLILVLYRKNYYLSIDLDSMEIQKHVLGDGERLDNVYFDGENLWINSATEASVFRVSQNTFAANKYDIPVVSPAVSVVSQYYRPFFSIGQINGKLVLMPGEEERMYEFDKRNDMWVQIDLGFPGKIERTDSQLNVLFWRTIKYNDEILFLPIAENGIWVMNKRLQFQRKIVLDCSALGKQKEYVNKKYLEYCLEKGVTASEDIMSLQDYVKCIESRLQTMENKKISVGNEIYDKFW